MLKDISLDLDDFIFDPRSGRFRIATGAGKGGFISRAAVLNQERLYLDRQKVELGKLGDRLSSGTITLPEFQREAGNTLRRIHIASAVLGKGGKDKMTQADWDKVQETIKRQLYKGRGADGKPFGIKHLAAEWKDGKVSAAQLNMRLGLYVQSGVISYSTAELDALKESGIPYAIRKISAGHKNCPECIQYASLPPQPIEKITPIGTACSCRSNCKCYIVGMQSLDEIERS
jgi:hypothetical protein